jgi:hypothetical protein
LEGFARTFLLAAFRIRGAAGLGVERLIERYRRGVEVGVSASRASGGWPRIRDTPQAVVESASVALALNLTRPWIWDQYSESTRDLVCAWLAPGLAPAPVDSNWNLFPLTVASFMGSIGRSNRQADRAIQRSLDRMESWYDGDGWYADGPGRAYDHYAGWALHFYPVMHAYLADDPGLLERYGPRLHRFLETYALLFGGDGAPVFFGRSLIYRFAAASSLWLGCLTGYSPWEPGTSRRIASGALRYFLDNGALTNGVLSLGWFRDGDMPVQRYSGPASPNWAAKAFVGLLISADDPEWLATERPSPVERADFVRPIGRTGMLAQGTKADGLVRLHNHGSDGHHDRRRSTVVDHPLYSQFAYSTQTSPNWTGLPSNSFGPEIDGRIAERGVITPMGAGDGWAASRQTPCVRRGWLGWGRLDRAPIRRLLPPVRPMSDTTVTAVVCAHLQLEVRIWLVTGRPRARLVATGWPVAARGRAQLSIDTLAGPGGPGCQASAGGLRSVLVGRGGFDESTVIVDSQHNPFGRDVALPILTARDGGSGLYIAVAALDGNAASTPVADVGVTVADHSVTVRWADGLTHRVSFTHTTPPAVRVKFGGAAPEML